MRVLKLVNNLPPGDSLAMTAGLYSLHRNHPGQFLTGIDVTSEVHPHNRQIWDGNPDVSTDMNGAEDVQMHYPAWHEAHLRPVQVLSGYAEFLGHALQVPNPLRTNRPMVYLSDDEKAWSPQVSGKYWVLNAGVKRDFTAKTYPWYQQVVEKLLGRVKFVQVGSRQHLHKPLRGTVDLIGQTDIRQLMRLVYHAQGVLCPVTMTMFLAAAFAKPAVILAGSRECRSWNTFEGQIQLSNVGALPCSVQDGLPMACRKSRVIRLGDGDTNDQSLCEQPVMTDPPSAKCFAMITPDEVVKAIEVFYNGGVLAY